MQKRTARNGDLTVPTDGYGCGGLTQALRAARHSLRISVAAATVAPLNSAVAQVDSAG